MGLVESVLEKALGPVFSWLSVRFLAIGTETSARLCTQSHILISWGGSRMPQLPLHIDVDLRLWNRGSRTVTVLDIIPRTAHQLEFSGMMPPHVLEAGGRPVTADFQLGTTRGQPLPLKAGDQLRIDLHLSAGGHKQLTMTIAPKKPGT